MTDDYIIRMIEDAVRALTKIFSTRSMPSHEVLQEDGSMDKVGLHKSVLSKRMAEGNINGAENYLFDVINEEPEPGHLELALWFYRKLNLYSDEQLEAADFSREEIADGLEEIQQVIANLPKRDNV